MSTRHFRELDLTLLSEYVSSHGHGSYMPCAIPMARAMIENGSDYAEIGAAIASAGHTIYGVLERPDNKNLVAMAATLFGSGDGKELGENQEYERGIVELICAHCGIPQKYFVEVLEAIHEEARSITA